MKKVWSMTNLEKNYGEDFQEIGHSGGKYTINIETDPNGQRSIQFGIKGSSPLPTTIIAVYALPQGIPVGSIAIGGIGQPFNSPPVQGCFPIFIASDSHGKFGNNCPACNGYWRSGALSPKWKTTCPYCGFHEESYAFLTEGQRKYIAGCCDMINRAMESKEDGEKILDMDKVADAVGKEHPKPKFYYTEQTQQNRFECDACGQFNDILGRYGYCSCCGTHNGLQELKKDLNQIRKRIKISSEYEACAKDSVAAFDSFARQIAKQLSNRIPMTPARKSEWNNKLFHKLESCAESLRTVFDIDIFKSMRDDDKKFAILMFHRRHVYEHNGGEVDEKYIRDSGDNSVRPKQVIKESSESAFKIANAVEKMGSNFLRGFHKIFTPEEMPIQFYKDRTKRKPN